MSENVAEIRGLTLRRVSDGLALVDGVSLRVRAGECVALVGESGSGKTLITRSLLGMIPEGVRAEIAPGGAVVLNGRAVESLPERQWRRIRGSEVGLVSQDALVALDPLRRIGREVEEPLIVHGPRELGQSGRRARVIQALNDAGMPEPNTLLRRYPHELSGGLRQRALIAQGIVARPDLLIADETTTALDTVVQAHVLGVLQRLKEQGLAILFVSHDLGVVRRIADRVLVLRAGTIVEEGPPDAILGNPQHQYTRMLVSSIPAAQAPSAANPPPGGQGIPVLSASRLHKRYPGQSVGAEALSDVSLSLNRSQTIGIVGESGSGKSTLARILMAREEPDSGEVLLGGEAWSGLRERDRRKRRSRIQLIHQDPFSALNPNIPVGVSIAEALRGAGVSAVSRAGASAVTGTGSRAARKRRVAELLTQVELDPILAARLPAQLSGGQRQRVAIARALAADPEVLVCDEAVSALDVSVQAEVLALLRRLQRDNGLAMVFISHDIAVVREMSHHLMVLQHGRVVEWGETELVLADPQAKLTQELIRHSLSLLN